MNSANIAHLSQPRTPDGRFAKRRKTRIVGTISSGSMPQAVSCIVRDTSSTGALIELERATNLPDEFTLVMPRELTEFRCRLAWRNGQQAGVRFISPARAFCKPASQRLAQRPKPKPTLVAKVMSAARLGKPQTAGR